MIRPRIPKSEVRKVLGRSLYSLLYKPRTYRTQIEQHTLGRRVRTYSFAPDLPDERPSPCKKVRCSPEPDIETPEVEGTRDSCEVLKKEKQWHFNDRFIRKFDQNELMTYISHTPIPQSIRDIQAFGDDFDLPIHPLFHSVHSLAPSLPLLYPVLRLATRFLTCSKTIPFLHQLITSPLYVLQPESSYYGVPLTSLPRSPHQDTGLVPEDRMLTFRALLALSSHIKFSFVPDDRMIDKWAYTERYYRPDYLDMSAYRHLPRAYPSPADLHRRRQQPPHGPPSTNHAILIALNFRGTNAHINISPSFLRILHPHTYPTPTYSQRLRASYFLAMTLVHELAHAIYMCRFAPPPAPAPPILDQIPAPQIPEYEPFYASQRTPELGHALETTLFNSGKLISLANEPSFTLGLGWQRFPTAQHFYVLNRHNQIVPLARLDVSVLEQTGTLKPRQAPRWETVYAVRDVWVWRQFFRNFWDGVEYSGLQGSSGFVVEKGLGSRCKNWEWDGSREDDGWSLSGCSSEEREEDGEEIVRG